MYCCEIPTKSEAIMAITQHAMRYTLCTDRMSSAAAGTVRNNMQSKHPHHTLRHRMISPCFATPL